VSRLRVLLACECSGRVRDAFAKRGWDAVSADILESETPAYYNVGANGDFEFNFDGHIDATHYTGDVRDLFRWDHPVNAERLQYANTFPVHCDLDGTGAPLWDLIIAFPPCTDLSYAGARWFKQKQADGRQQAAADFFMEMVNAPSPHVAVENPHSVMQKLYQPSTQIVQPWWFGDPMEKQIHLWLKGLPELMPDNEVTPAGRVTTGGGSWRTDKAAARQGMSAYEDSEGRKNRAKVRSRTFPGIARAMAEQWSAYVQAYEQR
jgi:hypothetical protein